MIRLRRASAIAALCVLASAATAYAECAWVLWHSNHHIPADQSDSGLFKQAAYDSYKSCRAAAVSQADELQARLVNGEDRAGVNIRRG